ncbi:glycosyltransferase [Aeromonas rivipollensis]|uniref:Glycosyltransferase n=1 Tax=Aeromonas rivipollensis TaxID=948519 RepID=A0ABX0CU29_9GAMM|nr:glycosyltransferase [Aeromonas rivipollensis]NEX87424.1 glycosyltransferase [Aeromonas rivipollensis]NEY04393.1 glycosyltransferase [Aeromonas rivipollensis]
MSFSRYVKNASYLVKRAIPVYKKSGVKGVTRVAAKWINRRLNGVEYSYITSPIKIVHESAGTNIGDDVVIISGVPFDDVGGGQRSAQLARAAVKAGRKVVYLYIYKKFDFEKGCHLDSEVSIQGIEHLYINSIDATTLMEKISSTATLIIEHPHPAALPFFEKFNQRGLKTVFELIDDWETSLGGDWFDINIYQRFITESVLVVGTAKVLVEKLKQRGRADAMYLPNAANEYIFDKYKRFVKPIDYPSGFDFIALYFGSLYGEWFAWDYLEHAAINNPKTAFILIGDKPQDKKINDYHNIIYLGAKNIEELPSYLHYCDFTLLPFVPGKISDAVSPIKVFEYLFMGKKVVSSFLPEIVDYPGVCIANDKKEFSDLCKSVLLETNTLDVAQANDIFISNNSWFARLDKLMPSSKPEYSNAVSAIILIHNNAGIIGRCLTTLIEHCSFYLKEIIVVDNNSSDGGYEYVRDNFPTVRIVKNPINGCSSGRNLGASLATAPYIVFFDSDQWFTSSSCFEEALSLMNRDVMIGAIGWGAGWFDKHRSDLGGMITDYCPNRAMNSTAIQVGYRNDIGYLATCGMFMPKSIFCSIDGFDVKYDPTCFEDTDLSFQIKNIGFKICYRDLSGIRHQPHQTTKANSESDFYVNLFNRNASYFKNKWGENSDFFLDYTGE